MVLYSIVIEWKLIIHCHTQIQAGILIKTTHTFYNIVIVHGEPQYWMRGMHIKFCLCSVAAFILDRWKPNLYKLYMDNI